MTLLFGNRTPEEVMFGNRSVDEILFAGQRVWPTTRGNEWDWEERFTSPTIPDGWEAMMPDEYPYNPPGFRGIYLGPTVHGDFELEVDLSNPDPIFWVGVFNESHELQFGPYMQHGSEVGGVLQGVRLYPGLGMFPLESDTFGFRFMLRRQGDVYTVLKDGEPIPLAGGAAGVLQGTYPGWDNSRIFVQAGDNVGPERIEAVRYRAI